MTGNAAGFAVGPQSVQSEPLRQPESHTPSLAVAQTSEQIAELEKTSSTSASVGLSSVGSLAVASQPFRSE